MKKFFLFALVATMFAACVTDGVNDPSVAFEDLAPETLTVSFEGADSRIQLNEAGKTVWTKDDLVSVFYRSNANQKWQFQGETGDRTGNLKRVTTAEATHELSNVVVVYPYNENYYINPKSCNIEVSLPAKQTYTTDSYGVGENIMVSYGEYNQVVLRSVCGWLKVQLTGNGEKIKSIKLKGNNGEQVAGQLYINSADATAVLASEMGNAEEEGSAGGNLVFEDTILTEVTLDCSNGVNVGKNATSFYIALPPQEFAKGITIEITDDSNYTMTQKTDKAVTIERNHILPMAEFKFVNPNTPAQPTPANNEIWYTATAEVEPYYTDEFGATLLSNVWDSTTGKGIITFNGNVTEIGYYAFYGCSSLTSITIPDSVTSIGESAFQSCSSMTSVTIPDSVTSIGDYAFDDCNGLTSITIPDSITSIGKLAFASCWKLTSVTIPDSVTEIEEGAFIYCSRLTSITIPDSVTSIGKLAFASCGELTSVTIPNSVTSIGQEAFKHCDGLTSITIPDSVTSIGRAAFYSCSSQTAFYGKFASEDNRCLVVDGVLNSFAPAGLTEYTIPDSVTSIGQGAFDGCRNLTSITIPDSVTSIGQGAFDGCRNLTSITIPDSVTSIGQEAFEYCSSLKTVYCKPTTPPTGGYNMFYNNASVRKIYVPAASVDAYKSKQYWSKYSSYIIGYDF